MHKWVVEKTLANGDTAARCEGHCRATCTRDKRSGLIVHYDAGITIPRLPADQGQQ